jgi:hypothetical protein
LVVLRKFSFVGQKPGKGKLTLKSDENPDFENIFAFDLLILPTRWEVLRDSVMVLIPLGSICFLTLHFLFNVDISYSTLFSSVLGVLLAVSVFFIRFRNVSKKLNVK